MKECPISEFEAAILDLVPHGYGRTIVEEDRRFYHEYLRANDLSSNHVKGRK